MMKAVGFPVEDCNLFKIQMLNWVNRFNIFCLLDNHLYEFNKPAFECLLAAGSKAGIQIQAGNAFEQLRAFRNEYSDDWFFGHFGYGLKKETENIVSVLPDGIGFPDLHFFVPEIVIELNSNEVKIYCDADAGSVYSEITNSPATIKQKIKDTPVVKNRINRETYLSIIEKLKQHILRGDCYVINFCQEFYSENTGFDPLYSYSLLTEYSPNPFSAFYRLNEKYCLCASPERYLRKTGSVISSQPIKGTAKRNLENPDADQGLKNNLRNNSKEKSENVMVVDLVRNDLSRICKAGTVKVDELFGLYSFPQVHQMISTISGVPEAGMDWIDCVKATFPMGSMTGAPKKKVMQLIEQYEQSGRGLFSGAIGYVKPGKTSPDFDFNVVIRSIFYNEKDRYLSFQTGGGITYNSDPEMEYEECIVKAEAILRVLQSH